MAEFQLLSVLSGDNFMPGSSWQFQVMTPFGDTVLTALASENCKIMVSRTLCSMLSCDLPLVGVQNRLSHHNALRRHLHLFIGGNVGQSLL